VNKAWFIVVAFESISSGFGLQRHFLCGETFSNLELNFNIPLSLYMLSCSYSHPISWDRLANQFGKTYEVQPQLS